MLLYFVYVLWSEEFFFMINGMRIINHNLKVSIRDFLYRELIYQSVPFE
jgi:hypothetical protein